MLATEFCRLCGERAHPLPDISRPRYYHCSVCDLIFMDSAWYLDPARERARYEQHDNTCQNTGYVRMFQEFLKKTVEPYRAQIITALDFGCGPGPVLAVLLRQMGITTDIYDPYFFPDKSYQARQYDLITATEVLEHLRQPGKTLQLLVSLLKDGGILAIMTHFHRGCQDFSDWWYRHDPTHVCFYSHQTMHWLARHFSLEILYLNEKNTCAFRTC